MSVYKETISLSTLGFSEIHNITSEVQKIVRFSAIENGIVHIFGIGSTNSVSVIEYEPALVEDVRDILEKLVPSSTRSRHSETWGDDNGFSHMRATLFGCEMTVPVDDGKALLGTWQQIVYIDHDNRPRSRQIRITVIGE